MSDVTTSGATSRRVLLASAGAVGAGALLAACGSEAPATTPTDGATTPGATGETVAAGTVLGKAADIPVGGGVIFKEQGVVVTQPTAGQYVGFSNICTHQACPVSQVEAGKIKCQCHFSEFSITDGSVLNPPAPRALDKKEIKVENGEIKLA
ncbi:Rieske (2Fe-2S) protein [Catellatospora paridis]|uniref:Rieske (2Fe-2S) protein n=1 Tax=Catellatospora paridis TaxID=1617086 RepID=UPI0012D3D11F|nr:Rieske (2Fe-2S) protein [Catellatospora paridis]